MVPQGRAPKVIGRSMSNHDPDDYDHTEIAGSSKVSQFEDLSQQITERCKGRVEQRTALKLTITNEPELNR